jgi:hypothetical protein
VVNVSLGYLCILPTALCALVNPVPLTAALTLICTFLTISSDRLPIPSH